MSAQRGYPDDWDARRRDVYTRDEYTCQRCGARGGPHGETELHAHHSTPVSDGGSHSLSNLTTVCKSCHEAIHGHSIGTRPSAGRRSRLGVVRRAVGRVLVVLLLVACGVALVHFDLVSPLLEAVQAAR